MSQPHPRTLAFESVETLGGNTAPSRFGWTMARTSKLMPGIRWAAWTTCAALALAFLWQPVGVGAQFALGIAVIAAMTLIRSAGKGRFMRWTFLALGSFVVLRYFYWRATQTLPDVDDIAGFTFGTLLALAELYCAFVLAISLTINADPLARRRSVRAGFTTPGHRRIHSELRRGPFNSRDDHRCRTLDGLSAGKTEGLAPRRRRNRPEVRRSGRGQGSAIANAKVGSAETVR